VINFLRWPWRTPQRKIEVIRRDENKLTLAEWRSSAELVALAGKVWSNPDFRMMIACLRNESPANFVLPDDAQAMRSVAIQRRTEGYTMFLANLEAMAIFSQPPEPLESTFEPEERELEIPVKL
jgi:hypothetical protein